MTTEDEQSINEILAKNSLVVNKFLNPAFFEDYSRTVRCLEQFMEEKTRIREEMKIKIERYKTLEDITKKYASQLVGMLGDTV